MHTKTNIVVQKYGGTSVGSLDRIETVATQIEKYHQRKQKVVVVVSAMAGETDRLFTLGNHFGLEGGLREMDQLVTTGEQITAALLSMALQSKRLPAVSLLGYQVPIRTTSEHGNALIESIAPQKIQRFLSEGKVVVIAGFQGVTDLGEITTLGRGGSDLTAVALAAALDADVCEIYKDVPGVFTSDPNLVADAKKISRLAYDEMLELASLGSKVLQSRSVQLAKRYMVPLHVRSSFEDKEGTWITKEEKDMEGTVVSAISLDRKEAQVSVRRLGNPIQASAKLFTALGDNQIVVDVIVQDRNTEGETNITFTTPRTDFAKALKVVDQLFKGEPKVEVQSHEKVAKVSAVGLGMRYHSGVAAQMFRALSREGIEIRAVSTSDIKISCVVDDKYAELAVRALHEEFRLAKEPN